MSDLTIKLLSAGACYEGNTFLKCAFNPLECTSENGVYRSSRWLDSSDSTQAMKCASQASMYGIQAMGRCTSNTDKYICTSDFSACQLSVAWIPFDESCTLVDDLQNRVWDYSYFGECLDRSSNDVDFCAWKSSDCPDEEYRFQWANPFFAGQLPDCRCDKVKTGACVSDLNPDAFFCAATEEVCFDEVGMSYLKPLEVESELDVTCMLCDKLPPPPEVKLVSAGACVTDGAFKKCALIPSHCEVGESFLPTSRILDPTVDTPQAANVCATQDGVKSVNVGRCDAQSNFYMCVPTAGACELQQYFKANDPECTVSKDMSSNSIVSASTYYGFCSNDEDNWGIFDAGDSYCVWNFQDCASSSSDNEPMEYYDANPGTSAMKPECRCDDVRTGACIHNEDPSRRHCAVQKEACDNTNDWTFVSWRNLEVQTGPNLICKLCSELPDIPPPSASVQQPPAASPTGRSPTIQPLTETRTTPPKPVFSPSSSKSNSNINSDNENKSLSAGIIGAIVAGSAVIVLIVVIVAHFLTQDAVDDKATQQEQKDEEATPEKLEKETENFDAKIGMEPGQTEEDLVPQKDHSVT